VSNERKPHKHAEVIKAWADGKVVQVQADDGLWLDIDKPEWVTGCAYRVKPELVKVRYRVAAMRGEKHVFASICNVTHGPDPEQVERWPGFMEWIHTEWQEVEIPSESA
jgi:hypothetical protein